MLVIGVFVNKMDKPILALKAKLKLNFNYVDAQIATSKLNFPEEFMGSLNENEGLIFHIEVPVKDLGQNKVFKFSDIRGQLENVEVFQKSE